MSCVDHNRHVSLKPEGYALVGHPNKSSRCVALHRLVYVKHNNTTLDAIKGLVVRHTCDNPRCINPEHLILGTRADNNRDRKERGRSAKAVPSRQKLGAADVLYIQQHYAKEPRGNPNSAINLAKRFGVDSKVIYRVLVGTYVCHGLS